MADVEFQGRGDVIYIIGSSAPLPDIFISAGTETSGFLSFNAL